MLAAIIIDAVVFGMIDIPELRRLYRVTRFDFWIAVAAILGVLSAGVLAGVVIGVVLSLGWLIYVATQPPMPLLGREPDTQVFRDIQENPADETYRGHRRAAPRRRPVLRHRRSARESHPRPRRRATFERSCSTSKASTSSTRRGRRSSTEIHEFLAADGVGVPPRARQASGSRGARRRRVVDLIGPDHIHGNVHRAVEAEIERRIRQHCRRQALNTGPRAVLTSGLQPDLDEMRSSWARRVPSASSCRTRPG